MRPLHQLAIIWICTFPLLGCLGTRSYDSGWKMPEKKNGVFRFVLCRASNLEGLAISRRDAMAKDDGARLIVRLLSESMSDPANGSSATADEREQILQHLEPTLRQEVRSAKVVRKECRQVGEHSYAAFLLAEIRHDRLRRSVKKALRDSKCSPTLENSIDSAIQELTVGWGGNGLGWLEGDETRSLTPSTKRLSDSQQIAHE